MIFVRKSLVARKDIRKGERFSTSNLTTKRPATGISPMKYRSYLKKKAKKNYLKDEILKWKKSVLYQDQELILDYF